MNKELFVNELKKINIDISVDILSKLDKYYQILVEENQKYNLTAITEENHLFSRCESPHFIKKVWIFLKRYGTIQYTDTKSLRCVGRIPPTNVPPQGQSMIYYFTK